MDSNINEPSSTNMPNQNKPRTGFSLDYRFIIVILLLAIGIMLALWRPWVKAVGDDSQTVSVTGEATLKAEPDEYVFSPNYQFKNSNKDAALAELTKKSEAVVTELKKLGVEDSQIKSNSNGNDFDYYYYDPDLKQSNYTLQLTVNVAEREKAQKIQDYLVSTTPSGAVSPQVQFSESKRKELENKARDEATKDARAKADQSARNLGFKVGRVKSVTDGSGFGGGPYPLPYEGGRTQTTDAKATLAVQPGQNDFSYSVSVVYFIR